jgi:hypothetical protein
LLPRQPRSERAPRARSASAHADRAALQAARDGFWFPAPSELLLAFFAAGLCFMLAAVTVAIAFAITGLTWLHWLALHLLFLGGTPSSCSA